MRGYCLPSVLELPREQQQIPLDPDTAAQQRRVWLDCQIKARKRHSLSLVPRTHALLCLSAADAKLRLVILSNLKMSSTILFFSS